MCSQKEKPISIPHRQPILLLTISHTDDVNLCFNSQLIITLPLLCCFYTGVCNKCRAAIICFSVIERFINMENTQGSGISADKQKHKYLLFFLEFALRFNNQNVVNLVFRKILFLKRPVICFKGFYSKNKKASYY